MTIKSKLITNVLVTAVIVAALSLASFFSMRFLQEKLLYLTETSTPFQIRTIELQRELQGAITALQELNTVRDMEHYGKHRKEAERQLARVSALQQQLEQQHNSAPGLTTELTGLARELYRTTETRITSSAAAVRANQLINERMQLSSARLKELDTSLRRLQAERSAAFTKALDATAGASARLKSIEVLSDLIKDLQHLVQNLQGPQKGSSLLLAKGRFNTISGRIFRNEQFTANQVLAAEYRKVADLLAEQIRLLSLARTQQDEEARSRSIGVLRELAAKLSSLFLMLEQEREQAGGQLEAEAGRQREIFSQSNVANSILVANSELAAAGLRLTVEINRLFTLESAAELAQSERELRSLFSRSQEQVQNIEANLTRLKASGELQLLHAAAAALTAARADVVSDSGVLAALRQRLKATGQAADTAEKLDALIQRQAAKGNEIVATAKGEQAKAVITVNNVIDRSMLQVIAIGSAAVIIGILFGFWIYRSVLLPLRLVLGAVRSQQAQGQEKAQLAEAVAQGDLNREVTISEVIQLDGRELKKDEMGMVLTAVVGMSEAQTTLDRALAEMTSSLRSSRDEEQRRDRLKSGLHELNRILREEHETGELLEYVLAFICAFLEAGVGIIYLYNERERLLQPAAAYAVSLADRPDNGRIMTGEGLVGQVAATRRMIHLATVPPGYLTITSALGEADPLQVAILPIMHNNLLAGVLELGSFRPFKEDCFEFLQQALEGIAVAVNNNRSRQLVGELLEQTQSQAEELRVQQEELQQTNEELEERARLFEERMRAL